MRFLVRNLIAGLGVFGVAAAGSYAFASWSSDYALEAARSARS